MADGAKRTPISQGLIQRAISGVKYVFTGRSDWFGPSIPLEPVAPPEVRGRVWDYPTAVNIQYQPRSSEAIGFPILRTLADSYDLLRLVIETRKDQLVKFDWSIKAREGREENQAQQDKITDLLRYPDKVHTWQQWLRMIIEDMLVIDAATIYPRRTLGGDLYSLDPIDGATIKVLIDQSGRTPVPPEFAYQQVLKGVPAVGYTREELVYTPRNPRTNRFYGYSPVEQILMTVNIALRRQGFTLDYYTSGSVPDALINVPDTWNPDQIQQFQSYWDSLLSGNSAERRKARFIPGGTKPNMLKEPLLKDEMDEWLARVVCFAFNLPPTAFVRQMNRATAQTAQETAMQEGLLPMLIWVKDLVDFLIQSPFVLNTPDLEFAWAAEKDVDPLIQAQIDDLYIRNGTKSVDEIREGQGMEPIGMEHAIYTATGPVFVKDLLEPSEPAPAPMALPPPAPGEGEPLEAKMLLAAAIAKAYKAGLQ
jgi:HK97 family phage portal protein